MTPYDREWEIANYVWQFYGDLFTAAEKRAHRPYLWERMKVEKKRDVVESSGSETESLKTLRSWGCHRRR